MRRLRAVASAALTITLSAGLAGAEPYPSRPVKMIVPFPPGGPIDVMARFVAQRLSLSVGQMIVENRPGAGGTIGTKAAAGAEPDGYTLLFGSSTTLAVGPSLYQNVGYDPIKSFTPIALISTVPFALVVAPALPATSVSELVAHAKAHPGKVNFGAPTGTLPHLTGEWFKAATATNIVTIPYKGAASAITDILTGQIDMAFEPTSVLLAHIHEGKVRALAITSASRGGALPDLPTMIESGLPGFVSRCRGPGWSHPRAPRPRSSRGSTRPSTTAWVRRKRWRTWPDSAPKYGSARRRISPPSSPMKRNAGMPW